MKEASAASLTRTPQHSISREVKNGGRVNIVLRKRIAERLGDLNGTLLNLGLVSIRELA